MAIGSRGGWDLLKSERRVEVQNCMRRAAIWGVEVMEGIRERVMERAWRER
jgi:hypothetical protein